MLVTINPAYRPFELEYVLRQSDAVALFLVDRFKSSDYFAMLGRSLPGTGAQSSRATCELAEFPLLRQVVALRGADAAGRHRVGRKCSTAAARSTADLEALGRTLSPHEPINIQYTSGTTGFPKAATLSHRNLLLNAYYVGGCQRMSEQRPDLHSGAVLSLLRLRAGHAVRGRVWRGHDHSGRFVQSHGHARSHRTLSGHGDLRRADDVHRPTARSRRSPAAICRALRTGIMSGSPCPIEVMRQVVDQMGVRDITIAYGQTEASPVITQTRMRRPDRAAGRNGRPAAAGRRGQAGRPGHRRDAGRQRARRAVCPRPRGDAGLLQEPRGHGRGHRRRRLAAHRRPGRAASPTAITESPAGSKTW